MKMYLLFRSYGPVDNAVRVAPDCYIRAVEVESDELEDGILLAGEHDRLGEFFVNSVPRYLL